MANPEHLKIIKQGVKAWNDWKVDHPDIIPDLSGAYLCGRELRGIDLSGEPMSRADLYRADLRGAKLCGANLCEADFHRADLGQADLGRANLLGADLSGANLLGAELGEANLGDAILVGTIFGWSNLKGSQFKGAMLYETKFSCADLSSARGLDDCDHRGPSSLDHRTLMQSGRLPLPFLRGCGLPDTFIEYLPSLTTLSPIQCPTPASSAIHPPTKILPTGSTPIFRAMECGAGWPQRISKMGTRSGKRLMNPFGYTTNS